jgi:hypothetical protein
MFGRISGAGSAITSGSDADGGVDGSFGGV